LKLYKTILKYLKSCKFLLYIIKSYYRKVRQPIYQA